MQQRKQFIDEYMKQESSLAELCRRFGISRKTGYKWVGRFLAGCELGDRSRRPHNSPAAVTAWLEDAIVTARRQRPRWGAEEAASSASASQSRVGIAKCEHVRPHLQAQRAGDATSSPSPDSAVLGAPRSRDGTQYGLVHGLQR